MSEPRGFAYRSNCEMMSQGIVKDFNCFEYSGPTGAKGVLALCIDDYAEIWVNGDLPRAAGRPSPATIQGFNMPQRLVLSDAVSPGDRFEIAVFGINGPISAAPENTVWFREARVEFF